MVEQAETGSRAAYEHARALWLGARAPDVAAGDSTHRCAVKAPDLDGPEILFEEFRRDGTACGAWASGSGEFGFGSAGEAIAAASGRTPDDPWVRRVCTALDRDRGWVHSCRRPELEVVVGAAEMFHVSAVANRGSIHQHGLDWRRMGRTRGVAGNRTPDLAAVFLCDDREEADWFVRMASDDGPLALAPMETDVWAVDVESLWIENGPDGWWIVDEPIPAERLRLISGSGL